MNNKNTGDGELDEILSQAFTDGASDTMWQNDRHIEIFAIAKKKLEHLIAQEATKARLDERRRFDDEIDDVLTRHSKNPDLSPIAELRDYNYNAISSLRSDNPVIQNKLEGLS